MVLGMIGLAVGVAAMPMSSVAVPNSAVGIATSVVGLSQGFSSQQDAAAKNGEEVDKDDPRLAKFNLFVHCEAQSSQAKSIHGRIVVLKDRKVS